MGRGTELGRVRGLGSAKEGAHHFWHSRLTAVFNLALVIWFIASLLRLPSFDYATVSAWLAQPLAAVPMLLLIVSVFYHVRLGLQVTLEDYIHDEGLKLGSFILLNAYVIGLGAFAVFSVLKIAFTGTHA